MFSLKWHYNIINYTALKILFSYFMIYQIHCHEMAIDNFAVYPHLVAPWWIANDVFLLEKKGRRPRLLGKYFVSIEIKQDQSSLTQHLNLMLFFYSEAHACLILERVCLLVILSSNEASPKEGMRWLAFPAIIRVRSIKDQHIIQIISAKTQIVLVNCCCWNISPNIQSAYSNTLCNGKSLAYLNKHNEVMNLYVTEIVRFVHHIIHIYVHLLTHLSWKVFPNKENIIYKVSCICVLWPKFSCQISMARGSSALSLVERSCESGSRDALTTRQDLSQRQHCWGNEVSCCGRRQRVLAEAVFSQFVQKRQDERSRCVIPNVNKALCFPALVRISNGFFLLLCNDVKRARILFILLCSDTFEVFGFDILYYM